MSDQRDDRAARTKDPDVTILRSPGLGPDRVTAVRTTITTTQSAGGLGGGKPEGGPQRTPERRAIDDALGNEPPRSGRDTDLLPGNEAPVETPEEVDATPPHGDELRGRRRMKNEE
jgi:hypothetical protein